MRRTAASSLVIAGTLLAAISLTPLVPQTPAAPPVEVQEVAESEAKAGSNTGNGSVEPATIAALHHKLSQRVKVDFKNIPLREAIGKLAEQIEADVIFDESMIEEEGLSVDNPVSLTLEHTPVTARAALEFMVKPQGLAFANRSGVLLITTRTGAEVLLTIKVYNVRDLVEKAAPKYQTPKTGGGTKMEGMEGTSGSNFFSIQDQLAAGAITAKLAQAGGMGMGMGMGMVPFSTPRSPEQQAILELTYLIQQTTSGPWFNTEGTGGSMMPFDGLIVVRQSGATHHEIQILLDGLRAANKSGPDSGEAVPKEDAPDEEQTQIYPGLPDLSILGEYDITPDARAVLIGMHPDESGKISQLEALRAVTLTYLPSLSARGIQNSMVYDLIVPLGVHSETWKAAINRANAQDKSLPDLKTFLDRAKSLAGNQPIDAEHLLFALMDNRENGPIPAVLASVGLTPERLQKRFGEMTQGTDAVGSPFGARAKSENMEKKEK